MTLLPGTAIDASDNFSVTLPVICGGLRQGLALPRQENVGFFKKCSTHVSFPSLADYRVVFYDAGTGEKKGAVA